MVNYGVTILDEGSRLSIITNSSMLLLDKKKTDFQQIFIQYSKVSNNAVFCIFKFHSKCIECFIIVCLTKYFIGD